MKHGRVVHGRDGIDEPLRIAEPAGMTTYPATTLGDQVVPLASTQHRTADEEASLEDIHATF
ncbi:MAG: hypothetical protein JW751_25225 [Polyangiaceae bacterium]|nr:hypothetical protein [Polyangiaceae bacterium]